MKNLLKLQEAIAGVLLNRPNRTAAFQKIAEEIERRYLFLKGKGEITLSEQVKLRTSINSSKYKH